MYDLILTILIQTSVNKNISAVAVDQTVVSGFNNIESCQTAGKDWYSKVSFSDGRMGTSKAFVCVKK